MLTTAKLFKNGNSQAVRLPKDFRFTGDEVIIKKIGNAVILLPKENLIDIFIESLSMFTEDFMERRDELPFQDREEWFE